MLHVSFVCKVLFLHGDLCLVYLFVYCVSSLSGLGVICLVCLGCLSFLPTSYIASVLWWVKSRSCLSFGVPCLVCLVWGLYVLFFWVAFLTIASVLCTCISMHTTVNDVVNQGITQSLS